MQQNNIYTAKRIAYAVADKGGRAYYVGGYVRDLLLGIENKDIDIEVHGLLPRELEEILDSIGTRITIGESFGIYGLAGCGIDVAMPRKEGARGKGHRDFDVFVDPFLGTKKAAERRDFTVNSLMQDVLSGEIVDHFGGVSDLKNKLIRHVNDLSFPEDELRVLRAAQFAARFEFSIADSTMELCRSIKLCHLSKERVEGELKKALLKATKPSLFFEVLKNAGKLDEWFGELVPLIGLKQDPLFHAEGDVWTHTMMVLDQAAAMRDRVKDPFAFMLAALTHDLGKAVCTSEKDGRVHSYEHEKLGVPIAESFLRRITSDKRTIRYALHLVAEHMKPLKTASSGSSIKKTNYMFDMCEDPEALICIALADDGGRISKAPSVSGEEFLYKRLEIYREYMSRPYVTGKDLIDNGILPGESFGELLRYAHKLRLAGIEKNSALKQTLAYSRTVK